MYHFPWKYLYTFLLFLVCTVDIAGHDTKKVFTLVIDAGHGGHDAGAVGAYSKEKNINLKVALAVGKLVEQNCPEVKVIYTRRTDVFIPLQRRADIANDAKADLFVSIHTNALPGGRIAYGSETYTLGMARAAENLNVAKRENSVITLENDYQRTYKGFDPNKAESYVIFEIMQDGYMKQSVDLARRIQREYVRSGRPDKGVHQAGFLVLRNTSMPSVLTELGFITTPDEEAYLNSPRGVEELSRGIYNGLLAYMKAHGSVAGVLPPSLPARDDPREETRSVPEPKDDSAGVEVAVVPVKAVRTRNRDEKGKDHDSVTVTSERNPQQVVRSPRHEAGPKSRNTASSRPVTRQNEARPVVREAERRPAVAPQKDNGAEGRKAVQPSAKKKNTSAQPASKITYRVQVGAGKKQIEVDDPQFKGLKIERKKEGTFYKYFYGTYVSYAAAQSGLRKAQAKLPGAYIVAYMGGDPISVSEARKKEK